MNDLTKQEEKKVFIQRLQRVHLSVGISFSILMYLCIFFGLFAIFLPYIKNWENISNHTTLKVDKKDIDFETMIQTILKKEQLNKEILIFFNDTATISLFNKDTKERKYFDSNDIKEIKVENTYFSSFLNHLHYGRPFGIWGYYIFALTAFTGVFLTVGGVILVSKIKYKNSAKTSGSFFSKYHRKIFIFVSPLFFILVLTGMYLNFSRVGNIMYSPSAYMLSDGKTFNIREVTKKIDENVETRNQKIASMKSIKEIFIKAQEINPKVDFRTITIKNYGYETATIGFSGFKKYVPFFGTASYVFSLVDSNIIEAKDVLDKENSSIFQTLFFYLHYLSGADIFTRLIVALMMLSSSFAIGFGVLLHLHKKNRKDDSSILSKVSIVTMIGILPTTGVLFVCQWLIPFQIENKNDLRNYLSLIFLIFCFIWTFYRKNDLKSIKEFLYLGGVLFVFSPIIHFISSGFNPISLYVGEMYSILGVDIGLFIFGLVLLYVAKKLPINREKVQEFWTKRLNKGEENR